MSGYILYNTIKNLTFRAIMLFVFLYSKHSYKLLDFYLPPILIWWRGLSFHITIIYLWKVAKSQLPFLYTCVIGISGTYFRLGNPVIYWTYFTHKLTLHILLKKNPWKKNINVSLDKGIFSLHLRTHPIQIYLVCL